MIGMESPSEYLKRLNPRPYLVSEENFSLAGRIETVTRIGSAMLPGRFEIAEHHQALYENAARYFAGNDSGPWSIYKGLYIYGKVGAGKTFFFKLFNEVAKVKSHENSFKILKITDIVDGVEASGSQFFISSKISASSTLSLSIPVPAAHHRGHTGNTNDCWFRPPHIFIDDLGRSVDQVINYGQKFNLVEEIIRRRYYVYSEDYSLTHISSNYGPDDLKKVFGDYVASRMREMFNVIYFPGEDKRK